jgi:hypothetical protein
VPYPVFSSVTVGDPLPLWLWFELRGGPGRDLYLDWFDGSLYYGESQLRPERVTFSINLGSPDVASYVFDAASESFVADSFGAGEANTLVDYGPVFQYPFPPPQPGEGVIRIGEWSNVFDQLDQSGASLRRRLCSRPCTPGQPASIGCTR